MSTWFELPKIKRLEASPHLCCYLEKLDAQARMAGECGLDPTHLPSPGALVMWRSFRLGLGSMIAEEMKRFEAGFCACDNGARMLSLCSNCTYLISPVMSALSTALKLIIWYTHIYIYIYICIYIYIIYIYIQYIQYIQWCSWPHGQPVVRVYCCAERHSSGRTRHSSSDACVTRTSCSVRSCWSEGKIGEASENPTVETCEKTVVPAQLFVVGLFDPNQLIIQWYIVLPAIVTPTNSTQTWS